MTNLCFRPAHYLRQLLLEKQLSARELLTIFEQQIERTNPAYNALVTLDFEAAGQMAATADEHLARTGEALGPLHGLPLAVKDVFEVAGMRTTYGNQHFREYVSTTDDLLVARERAAGAVVVGKSNTPDCASGGVTHNELFGLTRNPWNPMKTTSGSGGGGVAALASGMVCIADGTDVGGSARSPAAWTNCVGFRPSSGRIPERPGHIADGFISTAGVFARTVKDITLFMQACDGSSLQSAVLYPGPLAFNPDHLKQLPSGPIAYIEHFAGAACPPDISALMQAAYNIFSGLGLQLAEVYPELGEAYRCLYTDINAYAYTRGLPEVVLTDCLNNNEVKSSIKACVGHYLRMDALQIHRMWQRLDAFKVYMQQLMMKYPLIIHPTHTGHAFAIDDPEAEQQCDWAPLYLAPMLGLPAISVPAGFTGDGMPFGLMITGRAGEDMTVLRLAAAFEQATQYYLQRPELFR